MSASEKVDRVAVSRAAETLQRHAKGLVLTGRIVDGKVELDRETLDEIAKKHAGANMSFVAVNAPFDPTGVTVPT